MEHIIAKAATRAAYLIFDHETGEEFKAFANAVMETHNNKDASILRMYRYDPTDVGLYKTEDEQDQANKSDGLYDISPPTTADNDRQGLLPQRGGHLDGLRDVSQPVSVNNDRQGPLLQLGGR